MVNNRGPCGEIYLTLNGVTNSMIGWAREFNMNPSTFRKRLKKGLSLEEIRDTPLHQGKGGSGGGYRPNSGRPKGAKDKQKRKPGTGRWERKPKHGNQE